MIRNTLETSHYNPVLCSIMFPSISEYRNPEQNYLITGGNGPGSSQNTYSLSGGFTIWDLRSNEKISSFNGHKKSITAITAVCINQVKDGSSVLRDFLISGSEDGSIIIWEMTMKDGVINFVQDDFSEPLLSHTHTQAIKSIVAYVPPRYKKSNENDSKKSNSLGNHLIISVSLDKKAIVLNLDKILNKDDSFKEEMKVFGVDESSEIQETSKISVSKINQRLMSKEDYEKKNNVEFDIDKDYIIMAINEKLSDIKKEKTLALKTSSERKRNSCFQTAYISPVETEPKDPKVNICRHTGGLTSVAIYVPKYCVRVCDGQCKCNPLVITGSWDQTIIIWDLETRQVINVLNGHTGGVLSIAIFDPNYPLSVNNNENYPKGPSPILVSGGYDNAIIVWDLFEGVMIRKLPVEKAKTGFEKNSESTVGSETGHSAPINTVAVFDVSPDQNSPKIVSGGDDKDIIIWDLLSGHKIRTISGGHQSPISSILVRVPRKDKNDDFVLVSCCKGSYSKNVNLWDLSTTRLPHISRDCDAVTSLTIYDPNDGINNPVSFVAHVDNGEISVWDIINVRRLYTFKGQKSIVNCVAVHAIHLDKPIEKKNSYHLLLAGCDGERTRTITLRRIQICLGNITELFITSFKTSNIFLTIRFVSIPHPSYGERTYLLKGYGAENSLAANTKMWDVNDLLTLPSHNEKEPVEESTMVPCASLAGHSNTVRCMFSYKTRNAIDENKVFLVTGSYDMTAILWKLELTNNSHHIKYSIIHTLRGHKEPIMSIAVYIPPEKVPEKQIEDSLIFTASFDNTIKIWNSRTGTCLHELTEHKRSVTSISIYCPEDNSCPLLISTGIDKLIIVWTIDLINISNTKVLRELTGHTDRVCSIDVYTPTKGSKNSALIVSGSDDRTLKGINSLLNSITNISLERLSKPY